MQQFWHVFIAYAAAWALVFGWAVATFRRIGRVEDRLRDAGVGLKEEGFTSPGPGAGPGAAPGGAPEAGGMPGGTHRS
jgi:CcmD family protein